MASNRFQADYAKRVAGCKKCKQQLAKGEVRLAKISPNPFVQNPDGGPPPDMKQYFHPACLFQTFHNARATTKVIDEPSDIEGYGDLEKTDKDVILKLIEELEETRAKKGAKTPVKKKEEPPPSGQKKGKTTEEKESGKRKSESSKGKEEEMEKEKRKREADSAARSSKKTITQDVNESSKFNSFYRFCMLCDVIAKFPKHSDKAKAVETYLRKEGYDGDTLTLLRLLLPSIDQRVYNVKEKQIIKHISNAYSLNQEEVMESYKMSGDVSVTVREALEKGGHFATKKSDWSIQKVDRWLEKLSSLTRDEEQQSHLHFVTKRLSGLELQYALRLVKKDLRINAGLKNILDGLDPAAYEAFQSCHDLPDIVARLVKGETLSIASRVGMPLLPMLAEACGNVDDAMAKCKGTLFAEIKYDGERVQLHKDGDSFSFFSRSLKPLKDYKVAQFDGVILDAFPKGDKLILDCEVLLVDTQSGKPLPFGTLGIHKKENFKDASVCLFVFDILLYNDQNMMEKPLRERRSLLEKQMKEVKHRIQFSNVTKIKHGDKKALKTLILKAIDQGLEGIVVKDSESVYMPGKRRWLKVKKDYLEKGGMADTADLIVLGGYYGTGGHGGLFSVFLMGVYDEKTKKYLTVTKCGNGHSDDQLKLINKQLAGKVKQVNGDFDLLPSWLECNRSLVPDVVVNEPEQAPVWEVTGAEFSRSDRHSAGGISIRFPRVTRIRGDKDVKTATSLQELKRLFDASKVKNTWDEEVGDDRPLYASEAGEKEGKQKEGESKEKTRKEEEEEGSSQQPSAKKRRVAEEKKDKTEGDSDKPPCKYGVGCYRKNPQHWVEFSHPRK